MQFEAKNDGSGNPFSQDVTIPWNSITAVAAKAKCQSLGAAYDLISNPEWMVIARNVEKVSINWSSGVVGSGCLMSGNCLNGNACSYSTGTSDFGPVAGRNSKASLTLSSGSLIWDFSGNQWEFVDWYPG
ncbi:MAG: hypothetical protein KA715_13755 [Xanthomonadaceae bacterium]|nr:hypothetical protein [Xanthomonadaceae bacterium]